MARKEESSVEEFVNIWYSENTWRNLLAIKSILDGHDKNNSTAGISAASKSLPSGLLSGIGNW